MSTAFAARDSQGQPERSSSRPRSRSTRIPATPLFRVTTRRFAGGASPARAIGLVGGSTVAVGVAAGFLLLYVVLWTLATRGGFYRDELRGRIRDVRIERADLDATKHRLQSPDSVLDRARRQMGMVPAESRVFADLSGRAAASSSGR